MEESELNKESSGGACRRTWVVSPQWYSLSLVSDLGLARVEKIDEGCEPDNNLTSFQKGQGKAFSLPWHSLPSRGNCISYPRILRAPMRARVAPRATVHAGPGEAWGGTPRRYDHSPLLQVRKPRSRGWAGCLSWGQGDNAEQDPGVLTSCEVRLSPMKLSVSHLSSLGLTVLGVM